MSNKVIFAHDSFFNDFDLAFRNAMRADAQFQSIFSGARTDYPVDTFIEGDAVYLEIPIVDANPEDIDVQIVDSKLNVRYKRSNTSDNAENRTYIRRSIVRRDFHYSFVMSNKIDQTGITSEYNNGLLTIRIPKVPAPLAQRIEVKTANKQLLNG